MIGRALSLLRTQGPRWVLFRGCYALKLRAGWFERALPSEVWSPSPPPGPLADVPGVGSPGPDAPPRSEEAVARAERILGGRLSWFSRHEFEVGYPPPWFLDPWDGRDRSDGRHWSTLSEFSGGDVKRVWEQARFGFVFPLARAHARTGDARFAEAFWAAAEDWRKNNPPQVGPHWKCGQEVALRAMAWSFGLLAFRRSPATTPAREAVLREMLEASARRIEANVGYALSQKNNHGVSEAAGLFTAGVLTGEAKWRDRGRGLLESLARELIYPDGTFSQHSANYHRLMLHGYLWAVCLGRAAGHEFSAELLERVRRAGLWLMAILSPEGGRVPNLGANDGAHFLDLTDLGYLDYRPTVQAVGLATEGRRWLPPGPWDELPAWLGAAEAEPAETESAATEREDPSPGLLRGVPTLFADGGYAAWRTRDVAAVLRCPERFRHRPGQCDLLHFDLFAGPRNLLRDAGSYSYNCPEPWASYFGSSAAHNTVRFDDRDPMPKISRFLYGRWPRGSVARSGEGVSAAYTDHRGVTHRRTVRPVADGFRVEDEFGGPYAEAVLRWRLDPGVAWRPTEAGCRSEDAELRVTAPPGAGDVARRMSEGWESLHYDERSPLPVLEVRAGASCRKLTTEIRVSPR